MSFDEITGEWDYATLPPNVRLGRDCWLERKDCFGGFRSEQNPGLVLGDRVRVYTWATFNVEAGGLVEVGDDSIQRTTRPSSSPGIRRCSTSGSRIWV